MNNPQLVDYIRQHMAAGHTETTIRQHLLKYGWQADHVDAAFTQYHRSKVRPKRASISAVKSVTATRRPRRRNKRMLRLAGVGLVAMLVAVVFIVHKAHSAKTVPEPTAPARLTHQQEQTIDVITIGGAVGQYVAASNSTLPTRTAPGPSDNSVVLCGKTCDSTTWQVSALSAYKPANVKIVPYAPGLTTSVDTLLLVAGAKCNHNDLTTDNITPLSMVALYATDTSAGPKQHCVSL